jgi:NAD(P)H-hydrate repair Nnr-like enzyme with NAD(P)H-hydrate epimerase domain
VIKRKPEDKLVARLLEAGGEVTFAENDVIFSALETYFGSAEVLLDGLLGTGINLPLKVEMAVLLEQSLLIMQEMEERHYIIAVDCPSVWIVTRAKPRWNVSPPI